MIHLFSHDFYIIRLLSHDFFSPSWFIYIHMILFIHLFSFGTYMIHLISHDVFSKWFIYFHLRFIFTCVYLSSHAVSRHNMIHRWHICDFPVVSSILHVLSLKLPPSTLLCFPAVSSNFFFLSAQKKKLEHVANLSDSFSV